MCTPIAIGHPIRARTEVEELADEAQASNCTQCGAKSFEFKSAGYGKLKQICSYCKSDK